MSDDQEITALARWRYQPVHIDDEPDRTVTLCECHFDADGRLVSWTDEPGICPQGETVEELSRDLIRMLADTYKWQPVAYSDLRAGMAFERTGVDAETMMEAMERAELAVALQRERTFGQTEITRLRGVLDEIRRHCSDNGETVADRDGRWAAEIARGALEG